MPISASDARAARKAHDYSKKLRETGWYHSFEFPDGSSVEGVQSLEHQRNRFACFPIPADLTGKSVLDIGAWDGWFSFEGERRGATVTAVDCVEIENFLQAHRALGSRVDYRILDLYDLPQASLGAFDFVFFLGVLYHVKHPLLALEIVCSVTRETAIVESFTINGDTWRDDIDKIPSLEFYETDELGGHLDNWFGPSVSCIQAMARAAGFARVELLHAGGSQCGIACHRRWEDPPPSPSDPAPELLGVAHSRNHGINFTNWRDDYLDWWFRSPVESLRRDDLRLEIDSFGVPALSVRQHAPGLWAVNCRIPPGLTPGWKEVKLRTARSGYSGAARIAVDLPLKAASLAILSAADGATWRPGEVACAEGGFLSVWVAGLPDHSDQNNLRFRLGSAKLAVTYVGPATEGIRQINLKVPTGLAHGPLPLTLRFGAAEAGPFTVNVV